VQLVRHAVAWRIPLGLVNFERIQARGRFEVTQAKLARLYYVSGTVQGVGFRYFAQRVSIRIGLAGYVRNLRDGRVEVYALGTEAQLSDLKKELERGPRAASVTEVMEEEAAFEEKHAGEFSIEHGTW
jgi:acylphosphatase